jgi:hypothetical protein
LRRFTINTVNTGLSNSSYSLHTDWGDPKFAGCYVFAAPVDWVKLWNYDPTHPNWNPGDYNNNGVQSNLNAGLLRATTNAFLGQVHDLNATQRGETALPAGISINEFIAANAANCPRIGYVRGRGDYLVHWEHWNSLKAALDTANAGPRAGNPIRYDYLETGTFHDLMNEQFDLNHLTSFLNACGM